MESHLNLSAETKAGKKSKHGQGPFTRESSAAMVLKIAERFGDEAAEEWRLSRELARHRQQCKWTRMKIEKENERYSKRIIQLEKTLAEHTEKLIEAPYRAENRDIEMLKDTSPFQAEEHREERQYTSVDTKVPADTEKWFSINKDSNEQDLKIDTDESGEWELVETVTQEVAELRV